jgi:hypothetical protein
MIGGMATAGKTSVYLTQQMAGDLNASGMTLAEVVRRGLAAGEPEELESIVRRVVREELCRYGRDGETEPRAAAS